MTSSSSSPPSSSSSLSSAGRVAVITGASSGVGRASVVHFVRSGWTVVAMARTLHLLETLKAELEAAHSGAGARVVVEAVDGGDADAVAAMVARTEAAFGAPDVIINAAGLGVWKYLEDTSAAELHTMLGAPFLAAAHVCQGFLPGMLRRRRGRILHVGSPASIQPWPGSTAYACSRWALRGLHEALAMDLAGTGVSSTHVLFGEVSSSYFENNPESREHIPKVGELIPITTPEVCAEKLWKVATSTSTPAREVYHPFMLRLFLWSHRFFPGMFRFFVIRTGRKRLPATTSPSDTTA